MKPIKTIIVGSRAFFDGMEDFQPKDKDVLCIMDNWCIPETDIMRMHLKGDDVIFSKNMSKQEWIEDTLYKNIPMRAGKFLVPEFVKYIGFTIDDLKQLKKLFNNMDEKHTYEKIIYDSYMQNGKFELTDSQRLSAYNEYEKTRV